jgi:hypothetical protein
MRTAWFALALLMCGCETPVAFTAAVQVSASQSSTVSGRSQLVVTVTNTGPVIPHLGLTFQTPDRWYEVHEVTDLGGCTLDAEHTAFDCGDLASGATATYSISGITRQAGTFRYQLALRSLVRPFHYVNDHADGADAQVWEEVVKAA